MTYTSPLYLAGDYSSGDFDVSLYLGTRATFIELQCSCTMSFAPRRSGEHHPNPLIQLAYYSVTVGSGSLV